MADYLYRLGRQAFRNKWRFVGAWVLILALAGAAASTLSGPTSESFSIPGMPSLETIELQQERFAAPGEDLGEQELTVPATAQVVFAAPEGTTIADPEFQAAIGVLMADLGDDAQVADIVPPQAVSPDGQVTFLQVTYSVSTIEITEETRESLQAAVDEAREAGLQVEVGGDALQSIPEAAGTEFIGILVAAFVLVITLGSLVAAGLPLITGIVGVGIGISLVTAATGFIELSSSAPILASMLGLAVAIDYSLFIVSRYRTELALGRTQEEAAGYAVAKAGSAVVFAGLTVVVALSALAVVNIPFLTAMGLAAALTVIIAVLIALTLLPAIFGIAGDRILSRKARKGSSIEGQTSGGRVSFSERWGRFVTKNRWPVLIASLVGIGIVSIPVLDLELALPGPSTASEETTQRKAYDLLAQGFGPGFNGPLTIVIDLVEVDDPALAVATATATIQELGGVVQMTAPMMNAAGDTALFQLVPATGPNDLATSDLIDEIRAISSTAVGDIGVTGTPAFGFDVSAQLGDALLPYMLVVVGLALILLTIVFRSVLVPIKATLGFLLTIAATFGAVVAVFQWGWLGGLIGLDTTGPIMSMLPIFMIGIVFGLAMDYQLFIATRMREEYAHGAEPTEAAVQGLAHGGRVVTAAALIMISVFFGFLLGGDSIIKSMGFAMAMGVAIDAFIIRMTVVPAVMSLLGHSAWWIPRWLDRILPNVDVEGEGLRRAEAASGGKPAAVPAE